MSWSIDARIPILFADATPLAGDDALLTDGDVPAAFAGASVRFVAAVSSPHPMGCTCCGGRNPAAVALGRLFVARAKGEVAFFRRVVAAVADPVAVRRDLLADPVVAGRFRFV